MCGVLWCGEVVVGSCLCQRLGGVDTGGTELMVSLCRQPSSGGENIPPHCGVAFVPVRGTYAYAVRWLLLCALSRHSPYIPIRPKGVLLNTREPHHPTPGHSTPHTRPSVIFSVRLCVSASVEEVFGGEMCRGTLPAISADPCPTRHKVRSRQARKACESTASTCCLLRA